ncbi:MAG: FG-GAP-like repeat-containing protein [Planctomycetota bacterium]
MEAMKCLSAIWVCLALIAGSAQDLAFAQDESRRGMRLEERFKQLDRNGDGKLTRDEAPQTMPFDQWDANEDGVATLEEVQAYYSRRPRREQQGQSSDVASAGTLHAAAAVFELCVRDVEACAKFYRDGIGMREVEAADAAKGALLEWAGCYLRLRKVPGEKAPPATGNPMKQMLASNGFRWFSLWFNDPSAVADRLVKAGYPTPTKGRSVSFARDPDGNVVEIMGVPRSASGETFTWGMAVSDEAASRRFYGAVLGLPEFEPWNLPEPFNMKMYLFETGAGRIKFSDPPGDRPRDADAGPDAPGLRSVTLRVADLAATHEALNKRGAKVQEVTGTAPNENRLLLTDPDGNHIYIEQATEAEVAKAREHAAVLPATRATAGGASSGTRRLPGGRGTAPAPRPHKEEIAEQRPGEPPLKKMPDSDATRDAAGRGQLFESVCVPGITDHQEGTNGVAIADLNRDGLLDIVATYSPVSGIGRPWKEGERLRVFVNQGDFQFREHPIKILDSKVSLDNFGRGQVPNLADFNKDGFLDIFVTRHARLSGGKPTVPGAESPGNSLFVSQGSWDTFKDVSEKMGIRNEDAYNRQPSFGDVNKDGWLDIAIGCDNIGNAMGGYPHSRLYVFKPKGTRLEDGHFEDIGGTDLVPDFGGFYHDSAKDRSGPDINLRDLDNDGDLDLIQSYHVDVRDLSLPYSPVEYRQGVFCWKNLLVETGKLRFEKVTGNGLACEARLKLSTDKKSVEPVGKAPGLPYISLADVDNDGLLDVLAVGPASPGWAPRAEYVSGRFWRNKGNFQFQEATDAVGLSALNWVYRDWCKFFDAPAPRTRPGAPMEAGDRRPYFADAIFGDFNNDGWQDFVVLDRSEMQNPETRAVLFMNRGDGTFEVKPTTFSGLDGIGICGEAADLDNDGLLDLLFAADPDNSGVAMGMDRFEDKIYWNTGLHGGRENHWLRLRFSGASDADLIGARVEVFEPGAKKRLGMRVIAGNHTYKSGGSLEAHFGLGGQERVEIRVVLLNGKKTVFSDVTADRILTMDLSNGKIKEG